ncbi:MAG: transcriptional repressor [Pseudomonadota bacterium]
MKKTSKTSRDLLGFCAHDHTRCIDSSVSAAEAHCADHGLQWTPARRRVLEILLREHRALGAYEILDILREGGEKAQPPVAYRALDFLVAQGFAHRIEKLNAFIACTEPGRDHMPAFLICRICDTVAETQAQTASGALKSSARSSGFAIEAAVMEAEGVCPNCQKSAET